MKHEPVDSEPSVRAVADILTRHSATSAAADVLEAAREWVEQGFEDPEEVASWLDSGCVTAAEAQRLEDAGITPEQAALLTSAGTNGAEDTLARKLARGELSLAEARRLITREFWDG